MINDLIKILKEMRRLEVMFDGTVQIHPQLVEIHDLREWIESLEKVIKKLEFYENIRHKDPDDHWD